jgi:hemerythrin-like metal-binding protein
MCNNLDLDIKIMDTMHHEFLTLLTEIKECKSSDFLSLFENMLEHTKDHFNVEEEIMKMHDFYDKQEHHDEHTAILQEMHYFYEKSKQIPSFGKSYINQYAYEKFRRHVTNIDSQLAMFIKQNNISV